MEKYLLESLRLSMKYLEKAIFVLFCLVASHVNASTVSPSQLTAGGKSVSLSGLEWLPLTQTEGQSWVAVEAGLATQSYGSGWRFASRMEVEDLMDSLWGETTEGWYWDNFDGASWFGENFGWLQASVDANGHTISETHFYFGNGDCGGSVQVCVGSVRSDAFGSSQFSSKGFFLDGFGLSVGLDSLNEQYLNLNYLSASNHGVMLVRPPVSQIPLPASAWLFASAVFGLGALRRKSIIGYCLHFSSFTPTKLSRLAGYSPGR
jgi:hypothetical protein